MSNARGRVSRVKVARALKTAGLASRVAAVKNAGKFLQSADCKGRTRF
jgi:hypothetical protein